MNARPINFGTMLLKDFKRYKYLYIMILPAIVYLAVFAYAPMYGILMSFENFSVAKGVFHSEWVWFDNFIRFFTGPYFTRTLRNTLLLNFYGLFLVFPAPIIFALLLNEIGSKNFKRVIQTVSYLPYFISIVVVTGIINDFCSQSGLLTYFVQHISGSSEATNLLTKPQFFRPIYIVSDIWQYTGFGSIIYISALSGINPELYEAATIDGAGRWKQMIHITLAGLAPTIIILFILQLGSIMNVAFDKAFLLQNPSIYETADVIATFVYRQGLQFGQFSYATAVGFFNTVVNFAILLAANKISSKVSETSLF